MTSRTALCLMVLLLVGCADEDAATAPDSATLVMTSPVRAVDPGGARLSGTVRARFETPVSVQVEGRILERRVDAGDRVAPGQLLLGLDPRDFAQAVSVASADLGAARAELDAIEQDYAPDLVFFDISPLNVSDDNIAFLQNVDCAIIIAAAESTPTSLVDHAERQVAELTNVMGIVLNKCRYASEADGYNYYYY